MKSFEGWIIAVDIILIENTGVNHDSLEDWDWLNAFNNNLTPEQAVTAAFEYWNN